ncbi:MAG: B12-binding domain-containing radical SAM protein [Desulfotalea sp.]
MRIVLINPPNSGKSIPEEHYGIKSIKMIFRGEPLALQALAGNVSDHDVTIVDLKAEPEGLDLYFQNNEKPDLVGITGVTCEANTMLKIASNIKTRFESSAMAPIIVVGGHHASVDPEYFNCSFIDYVIVGLGKSSFRELVQSVDTGQQNISIPGIAKTNGRAQLSYQPRKYSFIDLVDDVAPRYDLVAQHRDKYVMSGVGGKVGFVSTAFGCTHSCFFCSIPYLTGGKYISHSIESTIRDIKLLGDIPLIRFVDANTFGDVKLAKKFAKVMIDLNLGKRIVADVRADTVVNHPELIELWHKAGLVSVVIGFEEISNKRLQMLNKKSKFDINVEALQILESIGINVIGDFIISPDYTEKEFDELDAFIDSNPIALPVPSILTPIPGTPIYRQLKDKITIFDLDYYTFSNAVMDTNLNEELFYSKYSKMLKRLHAHIKK